MRQKINTLVEGLNIHKMVKEWPITAPLARHMISPGHERRVYISLRSPSGKEKGRTLTIYRIPFNDVVKRIRAAFPRNAPERAKARGRPLLNGERVYVIMQPAIPGPGKRSWSRKRHRGRSIHLTAYGYGIDEVRERIKTCLGTIVI
jgi:hypothetical protein